MKLEHITPINEGVKFTTAQIEAVKKQSRDILIGVEYEYHVDDASTPEEIYDQAHEQAKEEYEQNREQWIDDAVNEQLDIETIEIVWSIIYAINESKNISHLLEVLDGQQNVPNHAGISVYSLDELQEAADDAYTNETTLPDKVYALSLNLYKELESVESTFRTFLSETHSHTNDFNKHNLEYMLPYMDLHHTIDESDIEGALEWFNNLDKIVEGYKGLKNDAEKVSLFLTDVTDDLSIYTNEVSLLEGEKLPSNSRSYVDEVRSNIQESLGDEYESYIGTDESSWIEGRINQMINNGEIGSNGDAEEIIEDMLSDRHNKWGIDYEYIREVTTDPSVDNGVEVITKPLPLDTALDLMERMFDHINDVGSTSNSTGMHVNLSIKHERFNKNDFDPLKLVMLMNNDEMIGRYPVRRFVDDIFSGIDGHELMFLAEHNGIGLLRNIREYMQRHIQTKYQGINFQHLFGGSVSSDQRRIEFRYMGGNDYQDRYNEISKDIYKYAYMTMASFDPNFLQKEYYKNIIRLLDKKASKMTFMIYKKTESNAIKKIKLNSFSDLRSAVDDVDRLNGEERGLYSGMLVKN